MNIRGISSNYNDFLKHVRQQYKKLEKEGLRLRAVLTQEHHLKEGATGYHKQQARYHRILPLISYSSNGNGGAAIFIPFESVEIEEGENEREAIERISRLPIYSGDGAIASVDMQIGPHKLALTSIYAPVTSAKRQTFFDSPDFLEAVRYNTLLSIDANCVIQPLDWKSDSNTTPNTTGAEALHKETTQADLADAAEISHPPGTIVTCHRVTDTDAEGKPSKYCRSRIDRVYTPFNDKIQWSYELDHSFWPSPSNAVTDHIAQRITMGTIEDEDRGRDVKRISEEICDHPPWQKQIDSAIDTFGKGIKSGVGIALAWEQTKRNIAKVGLECTKELKAKRRADTQKLEAQVANTQQKISNGTATPTDYQACKDLKNRIAELRKAHNNLAESIEHFARSRQEKKVTGSREFYQPFKVSHTSQWIREMDTADYSDITAPTFNGTETRASKIAAAVTPYYKALFARGTRNHEDASTCLETLKDDGVLGPTASMCAAKIDMEEVEAVLHDLPTGKAAGPDAIPNKIYKTHRKRLAPILLKVFNDALSKGQLPSSMLEGIVTLLYKKGSRKRPTQYRPITLLNNDYKILTRILTKRMNVAVVQFVSDCQNGFVPGGFIAENTMLLKLLQAIAEAEDSESFFLLADMEKAFDIGSWDYLHEALKNLGLDEFDKWVQLAYNHDNPPRRRLYVNGYLGPEFELHAGVAQGCPLSPLLFLAITEALSRMIKRDKSIVGIRTGGITHKLSQYADDSTMILHASDYDPTAQRGHLKHMRIWCSGTNQRENRGKQEAIMLGKFARTRTFPPGLTAKTATDKNPAISLGIPYCTGSEHDWIQEKYLAAKKKMTTWPHLGSAPLDARQALCQSKLYGSLRYYLFSFNFPQALHHSIKSDAAHLLWKNDPKFHALEYGSKRDFNPWIAQHARPRPIKEGGAAEMDWDAHVEAFKAQWMRRYLDPRKAPWKTVVDYLLRDVIRDNQIGRAIVLSDKVSLADLVRQIPGRAVYLRQCIQAFRALPLEYQATSTTHHAAVPIFHHPHINVIRNKVDKAAKEWGAHLKTRRLKDLTDARGEPFTDQHWDKWMYKWAPAKIRDNPAVHEWCDRRKKEMRHIREAVTECMWNDLRRQEPVPCDGEIWAIVSGGEIEEEDEEAIEGEEDITYVRIKNHGQMEELWIDTCGEPHETGIEVQRQPHDQLVRAALWRTRRPSSNNGFALGHNEFELDEEEDEEGDDDESKFMTLIAGTVLNAFPTPEEWKLDDGTDKPTANTFAKLTIGNITKASAKRKLQALGDKTRPNCEANWQRTLGSTPLPWPKIWKSIGHELTNSALERHWIRLLHRQLKTNTARNENGGLCRLCKARKEHMHHLTTCPKLIDLWGAILQFTFLMYPKAPYPSDWQKTMIFGVWLLSEDPKEITMAPPITQAMLRIAWGKLYIALTHTTIECRRFRWESVYIQTLQEIKHALISRAMGMRKTVAHRTFADNDPADDDPTAISKYNELLIIDNGSASSWRMTPLFENELYLAQDHLDKKIQHEQLQIAAAKKGKNHKKRERKELGCHAPPPFRPTIPAIAITPAPPSTGHHSTTITAITATPPAAPKRKRPNFTSVFTEHEEHASPTFPTSATTGRPATSPQIATSRANATPTLPQPTFPRHDGPSNEQQALQSPPKKKRPPTPSPLVTEDTTSAPPTPPNVSSPPRRRHPSPMTLNDCIEPCSLAYERYYSTASPSEH